MKVTLNFDMDGTIANLYGRPTWLQELRAYDPTPYELAEVMVNMSRLARYIHKAQAQGIAVNIISWLSKESNAEYDQAVENAKREWLRKHLPSVEWDAIYIVPYGTPKTTLVENDGFHILFDDELPNRKAWDKGESHTPDEIFEVIRALLG